MVSRPSILLVGQTPPPVHGQSLAIERLVRARFSRVAIHHIPMDFSTSMADVGRVRLGKIYRLIRLIWRVLWRRLTTGACVLYYPPAGRTLVPVLRDLLFLSVVRPFFPALVLDLHAGGLESMESTLPAPLQSLFRHAYQDATLVIERYPTEVTGNRLQARRRTVVPYGIADEFSRFEEIEAESTGFTVLFVGLVTASKGAWTLLDAIALLHARGFDAQAVIVGEFRSDHEAVEWAELLRRRRLENHVRHTGLLVGDAKWQEFLRADVFCFPSHYENEALPIVIIEAMQFGLPVVASNWRGIPYLVHDEVTGFLVSPGDAVAVADRLERLAANPDILEAMGATARRIYLERYTVGTYLEAMEEALLSVVDLSGTVRVA